MTNFVNGSYKANATPPSCHYKSRRSVTINLPSTLAQARARRETLARPRASEPHTNSGVYIMDCVAEFLLSVPLRANRKSKFWTFVLSG